MIASPGLRVYEPEHLDAALALLQNLGEEAVVIAGGTAVTIMLRRGLITPQYLVSLAKIPGLRGVALDDGWLHIGALTTHHEVATSTLVRDNIPVLADTFGNVGNIRVRCAATVGGVMAEADYASDPPTVLMGLNAVVGVRGVSGRRTIASRDFSQGMYETVLEPGDLVIEVSVPIPTPGLVAVYEKFVTRSAEDRPCVGVFAACRPTGTGAFEDVRVVVGAAAETPQRFSDVERQGEDTDLGPTVTARIAAAYANRIEPLEDFRGSAWYRREMISVWVARALERVRTEALARFSAEEGVGE